MLNPTQPSSEALYVSIVLPTFNEAENLPLLIPRIFETLERAGIRGEVIVVDDNSPDRTAQAAESLAGHFPVRVILRTQERGLASAVVAGFRASRATTCLVMDADGSHPVERLADLIRPILADQADVTVGSRNIPGGSLYQWPWHRRLISRIAASAALGLTRLSDPTSGFMAVRRELLEGVELNPVGWKIVLEVVVKLRDARLGEVPITFANRERGASKLSLKEQGNYLRHLFRLHQHVHPSWIELIRFCIVGFLGVFVDLATVASLKQAFALDTRLCAVGGFSVAVTCNYLLNRGWTFSSGRSTSLANYPIFIAVCGLGLGVRLGVIHALIELLGWDGGAWYLVTNLLGIAAATAVNFTSAKLVVFRPTPKPGSVLDR